MANEPTDRVPNVKGLLNPTLEAIRASGARASIVEIVNQVIDLLSLPLDIVTTPHGDGKMTELEYRLAWARTYLKTYGLVVNSGRGVWSLTSLGRDTPDVDPDEVVRSVLQRNRDARQRMAREGGPTVETHTETAPGTANESTISDLKAAIRRLETEKRRIDEQLRSLVTALRYFENPERTAETPMEGRSVSQHRRTDNDLRNAIADILASEGPLHRREVYDRLVERGMHIGGRDPVSNVSAHMSSDQRFRNISRGMWELTEPRPPDEMDRSGKSGSNAVPDDANHDQHDSDEEDSVPW